jgi:hypothetical protein
MQKRWAALALTGVFAAGLSGCGSFKDQDFTTRCAGSGRVLGFDANASHEVVVNADPAGYVSEAVGASQDIVKEIDLPPSDSLVVDFLVGTDLSAGIAESCIYEGGQTGIDRTLHATAGHVEIVLHPAITIHDVHADITLTNATFADDQGSATVESFVMENAHIGHYS